MLLKNNIKMVLKRQLSLFPGANTAQTDSGDSEVRGNVFESYSLDKVRLRFYKIVISFFRCKKLKTFNSLHCLNIEFFENFTEKSFEVRISIVHPKQAIRINSYKFAIFKCLNCFKRRCAGKKTFSPGDNCIFEFETFCDVYSFFKIVDTNCPFLHKIDCPARMPNRLHIGIF